MIILGPQQNELYLGMYRKSLGTWFEWMESNNLLLHLFQDTMLLDHHSHLQNNKISQLPNLQNREGLLGHLICVILEMSIFLPCATVESNVAPNI